MFQELYAGGWEIIISSDLSRVRDLSTFFLKRPAIPIKDAANVHIFTVTLRYTFNTSTLSVVIVYKPPQ